jgi:hypothetical protein
MATGAIGQLAIIQQLSDPAAMRSKITGPILNWENSLEFSTFAKIPSL